jgi:hypothetical protein
MDATLIVTGLVTFELDVEADAEFKGQVSIPKEFDYTGLTRNAV